MRSPHYSWRAQKVKNIVQDKPKKKRKHMRKGYWKAYDKATKQNLKKVYEFCLQVCKELGPPWKIAKTGKPPTMMPEEHTALHIVRRRVGKASRFVEQLSPCVTGKTIDHSNQMGKTTTTHRKRKQEIQTLQRAHRNRIRRSRNRIRKQNMLQAERATLQGQQTALPSPQHQKLS